GSGTWSLSSLNMNWNNGTGNIAWPNGGAAVFGGSGAVVTVDDSVGGVGVSSVTINSAGYQISGDALTLGNSQVVFVQSDATISAILAGTSGFEKSGSGILSLTAVGNTFSGDVKISGGGLSIAADGSLGSSSVSQTITL